MLGVETRIELTREARSWLAGLSVRDRSSIVPVIEALSRFGDQLQPSVSKPIKTSQQRGMRELRSLAGNLRLLYVQERGRAVMCVGGDKTGHWNGWYPDNIRRAEQAYRQHRGGEPPWGRTGERGLGR